MLAQSENIHQEISNLKEEFHSEGENKTEDCTL